MSCSLSLLFVCVLQFWHQDKDNSRLDSSSIFEDLDRYCWQQQTVPASATTSVNANNNNVRCSNQPSPTSPQSHVHQQQQQQQHQHQQHQHQQQQQQPNPSSSSSAAGSSSDTISSLDTTDGQIYTLTVLNGGEPWLKRETEQLPSTLDLDSLLGSFPGYIKSEYPYDDSGFSTDGKDVIVSAGDANGLSSISSQSQPHGQTLPSLVTAISIAGGGGGGGGGINELGQQLAQFQNNNNDWHMADHNAEAEQNSAESLLRSALQGKGYAKGLHMQNGLSLPVVKDDEMRRLLFTPDDAADALGFADSTLNAAQMFDDGQAMNHAGGGGGGAHMSSANHGQHGGNASIIVDDMFLSLENAFSDDFEKIKRLANEVQQFCSSGTPTPGDYGGSDVLMQISPSATATATTTTPQLQPLANAQQSQQQQQQQQPPPPPQPLKPEVSTSTATTTVGNSGTSGRLGGVSKPKKQYKRSNSSANNNNNNNNPNVANNNNNSSGGGGSGVLGVVIGNGGSSSSSGSASSSSNSPPANCSASGSSASSGGGSQRKERSLHYCSICSKGFKDKYSVNVHIRTHTGEKPFACSLCGKSFRQKAHLAKHYQTHMTQKNNGSLIKGSSAKHQRGGGGSSSNSAASLAQQQRQLSSAVASAVGSPSLMSAGVVLSGSNTSPSVLPPANGLVANR